MMPSGAAAEDPARAAPALADARPAAPRPAVARLRVASLALVMALVALGLAWELWLAPTGRGTLAIKVLPLVALLAGLSRHRLRSYRVLSLLVWLYVLEGLTRGYAPRDAARAWTPVLAWLETGLALALFGVVLAYVRQRFAGARTDEGLDGAVDGAARSPR